jgi:hypothetical protein
MEERTSARAWTGQKYEDVSLNDLEKIAYASNATSDTLRPIAMFGYRVACVRGVSLPREVFDEKGWCQSMGVHPDNHSVVVMYRRGFGCSGWVVAFFHDDMVIVSNKLENLIFNTSPY